MSESHAEHRVPEWTLGDRLRKALDHGSVSVEAMAEYLEYSTATLRNWTHDRVRPRDLVLRQWALKCGVPYAWLEDGSGDGPGAHVDPAALEAAIQEVFAIAEAAGVADALDFRHALGPVLALASGASTGATRYYAWSARQNLALPGARRVPGTAWGHSSRRRVA